MTSLSLPTLIDGTGTAAAASTAAHPLSAVFGQTAAEYVADAAKSRVQNFVAMGQYSALFRSGQLSKPEQSAQGPFSGPQIVREHRSQSAEGEVLKFALRVPISNGVTASAVPWLETESVLIPMVGRTRELTYTLCVSSQVGCAMGCTFCQTGQMGLIRSLSAAEIVAQWFAAQHLVARPDMAAPIRNIVFMGMGEPMDNLDAVLQAVEVLTDRRGPAVAMSRITISTVGRIDGIKRLAARIGNEGWHRLGLAVSLNAPNDAVRSGIMPINRGMPMAELRAALSAWPLYGGTHLCIEYVLIPGVNDQPEHAAQLAAFMKGESYTMLELDGAPAAAVPRFSGAPLQGLVNVIPYNPRDNSPWPAATDDDAEAFMLQLKAQMVYCKRRRTKGRDTMAACGQLGNAEIRRSQRAGAAVPSTVPG